MQDVFYHCVTGHRIQKEDMKMSTDVVVLDGGATVRLCRVHGAPVSIDLPQGSSRDDTDE